MNETNIAPPAMPAANTKWGRAITETEKSEKGLSDLDKIVIGALAGSAADKATCVAYLRQLSKETIQAKCTTGAFSKESRWQEIAAIL